MAADIETNEAFRDRKTTPADFDKLEGCNPKGQEYAHRSSRARSTLGQENEAWALNKKNPSRLSLVDLSRDRYIALRKLATPFSVE